MKKIQIYYFSGTGNTLLVVKAMAETFRSQGLEVETMAIEKVKRIKFLSDVAIGLAFPVAIQGTYKFIWDFVDAMPRGNNPVFMVDTLMMYSGGIVGPMRNKLKRKGYQAIGAREIPMPLNAFRGRHLNTEKDESKRQKGLAKARKYALDLIQGRARWSRVAVFSDMMSVFSRISSLWSLYRWSIPLRVDKEKCSQCGICVKLCPVNNLRMNEYPQADKRCELCMRCISYCPDNALSLGKYNTQYKALRLKDII